MKNQTLSKKQMDHLVQLGLSTKNASIKVFESIHGDVLYYSSESEELVSVDEDEMYKHYSTFTLYDILKVLPRTINECILSIDFDYCCFEYYYYSYDGPTSWHKIYFNSIENIMDGAYEMLIWVVENGYLNLINQKHENI